MKKILVPIDGSEVSLRAVEFAKSMFQLQDKTITIFSVIPNSVNYYITNAELLDQISEASSSKTEELLQNIVKGFEGLPGRVNYHYTMGDPAAEIIRFAEDNDYDIIVMGSRGLGSISKTILGSVSTKVLHRSKHTVVIVK
ncbi:MAG: universal stress protein [Tissierellia bacterium]|nr:universal stress protein [Tissierellia bacterium]